MKIITQLNLFEDQEFGDLEKHTKLSSEESSDGRKYSLLSFMLK